MPENYDAWKIYSIVSGQLIMGPGGPVDINHDAIHRAMDLYGIENKRGCFEQVCKIGQHVISEQHKRWKAERESRDRISRSKGRY